jgi:hypothetical protein
MALSLGLTLAGPAAAQEAAPGTPPRITYEDLLTRPDDLSLAYAFAKQEVRDGNVLSALSTLERMLLLRPDLHDVRLFYAILLYRLDNMAEAKIQLDRLADEALPLTLAQEVTRYQGLVADSERPLTASLTAGLGLRYDSNRNGANQGEGLFFGFPVTFLEEPQEDWSRLTYLSGRFDYDLGLARPLSLFASATAYDNDPFEVDDQAYRAFSLDGGLKTRVDLVDLTFRAFGQHLQQDGEAYTSAFGLEGRADYQVALGTEAYGLGRAQYEVYEDTDSSPNNSTRDGGRWRLGSGLSHSFAPDFRVSVDLYGERKEGDVAFESYWRLGAALSPLYLLGEGQYVSLRLYIERDAYDASDPLVTSFETREDLTRGFSLTYGLPIATLADWMEDGLGDSVPEGLGLAFTVDGRTRRSNIENYDTRNWGGQSLVTYRLSF